jgi:hypothetical protein
MKSAHADEKRPQPPALRLGIDRIGEGRLTRDVVELGLEGRHDSLPELRVWQFHTRQP